MSARIPRTVSAALVAVLASALLSLGSASPAAAGPHDPGLDTTAVGRGVCDQVEKVVLAMAARRYLVKLADLRNRLAAGG